jgi:hypothetical protein
MRSTNFWKVRRSRWVAEWDLTVTGVLLGLFGARGREEGGSKEEEQHGLKV